MKPHPYLSRASAYFRLAEKARRAREYPQAEIYQRIAEEAIRDFQDMREYQKRMKATRVKS